MAYVALKPCGFAGRRFKIGECIPDELLHDAKGLVKMGLIAESEVCETKTEINETIVVPNAKLSILVQTSNGEMTLEPTDDGVQDVFSVLIGKADDAEAIINQMTDADALILLHMADSRKSVKALAEARGKALSAGEQ